MNESDGWMNEWININEYKWMDRWINQQVGNMNDWMNNYMYQSINNEWMKRMDE